MSTASTGNSHRTAIYLSLLAVQVSGATFVELNALPVFKELLLDPGKQLASTPYDSYGVIAILFAMQLAFWYRLFRVPIPFEGPKLILSHVFLFLGRLSFIFGGALFSIALFRHLPDLGSDTDILLTVRRGIWLVISLFALFCATLELERLGRALGGRSSEYNQVSG